ncbi:serine dehydratase subunit alpha family protein [Lachnospiraceae bacterium KGMB03038]|nr:serine dehydratase subunit alpha family protein [Lachnospiraceae bacterium KGMB03038]
MQELTRLIKEDMKPALGVTEPGAIAFAVATARSYLDGAAEEVSVALNSGMYKNAFTCGIPNSSRYGNLYAAALGAVAAKAEKGLESLADITPEDDEKAARMVEEGKIKVWMDRVDSRISIDASVRSSQDVCTVRIRDSHTHIVSIEKNGERVFKETEEPAPEAEMKPSEEEMPAIHRYRLSDILTYIRTVPEEEISFIREAFSMNMDLLEEGIHSGRAVIAGQLLKENGGQIISEDARKSAQLLCNGAIEARVLGLSRPAMSITGSGAHGIIAAMPLFAYYEVNYEVVDDDLLLRATALSYLITMYIKEYSGKLSAFCGCGIAAGTGMACGLAYLRGGGEEELTKVIQNMASGLTGMICDGGNHGCVMKGITAVDAAFRAVDLAMEGICIENIHGINGKMPEDTMRNMGLIASPGMEETEKTIVEIMENK